MKNRIVGLVCVLGLGLALSGCNLMDTKAEIETVADGHFRSIQGDDLETALGYYSTAFFQDTPRDDWERILSRKGEKLGELQSWHLQGWNSHKNVGQPTTHTLNYRAVYSKHGASEQIVIIHTDGAYRIAGHHINSMGLLQ